MEREKNYVTFPGWRFKTFTCSWDDGTSGDRILADMLRRYGAKGTFNINYEPLVRKKTDVSEKQSYRLWAEELQEVYGDDMELAIHGFRHFCWGEETLPEVVSDVLEDRRHLERLTGRIIRGAAHPNSSCKREFVDTLRMAGLAYCRVCGTGTGIFKPMPEDFLNLEPTVKYCDPEAAKLARRFIKAPSHGSLMMLYVWGHAHECIRNGDFDRFEEILQTVCGREDVWYATNLEIADYMEDVRLLRYSADGSRIYNPSARDIWMLCTVNGEEKARFKLAGGETAEVPYE